MDNDRSEDTSPSVSPRLDSAASTGSSLQLCKCEQLYKCAVQLLV